MWLIKMSMGRRQGEALIGCFRGVYITKEGVYYEVRCVI
jgi:hypothetical protein